LWGDHCDYDVDFETDDYEHYSGVVKEDFGTSFGNIRLATSSVRGMDGAWNELDRMLCLLVEQKESGLPMTKEKELKIFGGPRGEHRHVLKMFTYQMEARIHKRK